MIVAVVVAVSRVHARRAGSSQIGYNVPVLSMRAVVGCLAWLAAGAAAAQAGATGPADLVSLTASAEAHSQNLEAARHRIAAAEAQLSEARISPFFQFKSQAGFTLVPDAGGVPGFTPDPVNEFDRSFGVALSAGIDGVIPLWTFGKISAAKDAARAGVRGAGFNHKLARQRLVHDVRRAYYGLQLALDTRQMIDEGLPKLERALKKLDGRVEDGEEVDEVERHRLTAAIAEVRSRSIETDRLEKLSRHALRTLTGLATISVPNCPIEPVAYEPSSLPGYQSDALGLRPELGMLDAAQAARQAKLDEVTARYYPDLALALKAQQLYIPGRTAYESYTPLILAAGLVARWNMDLWGNSYRQERARQQLLETRAQARLASEGIALEVAKQHGALAAAELRRANWEEAQRDARRWFVESAQGFQIGVVKVKELLDGVKAYFAARFSHLQSIHDQNVALSALERAVGRPLVPPESWGRACEPLPPDDE